LKVAHCKDAKRGLYLYLTNSRAFLIYILFKL
jgi:hypothetical protein